MTEWRDLPTLSDVAAAIAAGDEIEATSAYGWIPWGGNVWNKEKDFRARPRQPKKKVVKSLCWRSPFDGQLFWSNDGNLIGCKRFPGGWQRFPAGDIEGEVEE